jgi:hypothetical protein
MTARTGLTRTPRVLRGGIVLVDLTTSAIERVITLQYNPDTITRSLQIQGATGEAADMVDVLRLKGPPIETIKLEAELDATDDLEDPESNPNAVSLGVHPQLAALETIVYPPSSQVQANLAQARAGVMEILPTVAPLQLFVWSRRRILPVRITELSITEEAFDPALNPIRAKVSLGMRVLSNNDIGFDNKGGSLFMAYHQQKERLARLAAGAITALGLDHLP